MNFVVFIGTAVLAFIIQGIWEKHKNSLYLMTVPVEKRKFVANETLLLVKSGRTFKEAFRESLKKYR